MRTLSVACGLIDTMIFPAGKKQGMNTLRQPNPVRNRHIAVLIALCLLQYQTRCRADYTVQVGAFTDEARAAHYVQELQQKGLPAAPYINTTGTRPVIRVRIGPYPDWATARKMQRSLEAMDIPGFVVTSPSSLPAEGGGQESAGEAEDQEEFGAPSDFDDLFGNTTHESNTGGDETVAGKYNIRGFFNSKVAYTYPSPEHASMFRNTLELQASDRINSDISWKISARGSYDAVFDLDEFYPDRVEDNRRLEGALHETYLDISKGDWDMRLGRQHIIWGEMVGLFFADVVSAKDMRQWVAEDFDLIRIPQWAVRAENFKGDFHAEAIWIPYMTYDEIGEPGDDFYPLGTEPPPGVDEVVIRGDDKPSQKLSNSGYGLRLSMLKQGWDLSGFYYSSMDPSPTFFRTIEAGQTTTLIFEPGHERIHQFGGTMAKDFRDFLLKGEAVYTADRRYAVGNLNDADGVKKQNTLDYVIGLERTSMNGTLFNVQFFQRWYTDHDSDNIYDEFESGASFYTRKDLTGKLKGELLLISSLNREDWMFRPKLDWELNGNWLISAGVDIFGGDRKGLIGGRFDDSDRVYGNVRYTF